MYFFFKTARTTWNKTEIKYCSISHEHDFSFILHMQTCEIKVFYFIFVSVVFQFYFSCASRSKQNNRWRYVMFSVDVSQTRNTFCGTWYLPHSRVHKSIAELCSNFGDSAITKGQISYLSLRIRKTVLFLLSVKIWRHHRVRRPRFPIRCRNFGDSSIHMGQIAYFSLRMRETPIILLPVKNLTSPSCSPTPISYNTREFWRYVNI